MWELSAEPTVNYTREGLTRVIMRETHTPHFTTTTVDQASTRNHSMSDSVPDDHQPGSVSQDARNVHRSTPDPKTVEMIAYYQQAHKDHGFRLIEVRYDFIRPIQSKFLIGQSYYVHSCRAFAKIKILATRIF